MRSRIDVHINLEKAIESLSTDKVLKVGWNDKKKYENGTYYAEAAATNEYGAPHRGIPPRPFLAPTVTNNRSKWMQFIQIVAKRAVNGEGDILTGLDALGYKVAGNIAESIREVTSPPLSPYTIAARLSKLKKKKVSESLTKPLIDTGTMLRSITHSVEEES